MKKSYLALGALSLMVAANAMAAVRVVAKCSPEHPRPDQGYSVMITERSGMPPGSFGPSLIADVNALTIAGPRLLESFRVKYVPGNPHRPGSAPSYLGRNFKLQFFMHGGMAFRKLAHLEARTRTGQDVSEKLVCKTFN